MFEKIHLIDPSSDFDPELLRENLEKTGCLSSKADSQFLKPYNNINQLSIDCHDSPLPPSLVGGLCKASEKDALWAVRGGYGAQQLLPFLDKIEGDLGANLPLLIGYSDVSALHAYWVKRWNGHGIHAPMPATNSWAKTFEHPIEKKELFSSPRTSEFTITLTPINEKARDFSERKLTTFGGCLSVLTSLIGTPYLPSFADHCLFFEDINESPGQIARHFSQWQQSGNLDKVSAVILGQFLHTEDFNQEKIKKEFANKNTIPVFSSGDFGHGDINIPLPINGTINLNRRSLTWGISSAYD